MTVSMLAAGGACRPYDRPRAPSPRGKTALNRPAALSERVQAFLRSVGRMDQPEALLRLVLKWPARGKCSQRNEEWIYPDYPMLQESIPGRIGFSFAFFFGRSFSTVVLLLLRAAGSVTKAGQALRLVVAGSFEGCPQGWERSGGLGRRCRKLKCSMQGSPHFGAHCHSPDSGRVNASPGAWCAPSAVTHSRLPSPENR